MILVPLQTVPTQTLTCVVSRQNAQIELRQNGDSMYFSLSVNDTSIVRTRVCRDRQRMLRDVGYRGFIGDFAFVDTRGASDPQYFGLGSRFLLYYLGAGE